MFYHILDFSKFPRAVISMINLLGNDMMEIYFKNQKYLVLVQNESHMDICQSTWNKTTDSLCEQTYRKEP